MRIVFSKSFSTKTDKPKTEYLKSRQKYENMKKKFFLLQLCILFFSVQCYTQTNKSQDKLYAYLEKEVSKRDEEKPTDIVEEYLLKIGKNYLRIEFNKSKDNNNQFLIGIANIANDIDKIDKVDFLVNLTVQTFIGNKGKFIVRSLNDKIEQNKHKLFGMEFSINEIIDFEITLTEIKFIKKGITYIFEHK